MSDVVVVQANYTNPVHAQALRDVLNHYAKDPMGGGEALSAQVLEQLPAELAKRPPCVQRTGLCKWRGGRVGQLF